MCKAEFNLVRLGSNDVIVTSGFTLLQGMSEQHFCNGPNNDQQLRGLYWPDSSGDLFLKKGNILDIYDESGELLEEDMDYYGFYDKYIKGTTNYYHVRADSTAEGTYSYQNLPYTYVNAASFQICDGSEHSN